MHNKRIFWNIKIQINFHSSVMGVAWHSVPYTARLQFCHAHFQLAAFYLSRQNVFTNRSVIGLFQCSQLYLIFIFYNHNALFRCSFRLNQHRRICMVRRCAVKIEFCRYCAFFAGKSDFFYTHANVHAFFVSNFIFFAVCHNDTCAADVDNSHLTSLQEILCS